MIVFSDSQCTVHRLRLGPLKTNCFLVTTSALHFLIDPASDAPQLIEYCRVNNITPMFALATHPHFDHFAAAADLIKTGQIEKFYFSRDDQAIYKQAQTFSKLIAKEPLLYPEQPCYFDHELSSILAQAGMAIMPAPGHTPGSAIIYRLDLKLMFSGDTIVHSRLKSEDNPFFENKPILQQTLIRIKEHFPPRCIIFPGHGPLTLLETEFKFSPKIEAILEGSAP